MSTVKVSMMVGLPASGKSSYAQKLSQEENTIILASDSLRAELYGDISHQDNNGEVFAELYRRAKEYLTNSQNVIIDATNISSKRRIHFCKEFKQFCKECVYMTTSYQSCLARDVARDRNVGQRVIDRMYRNLQIPFQEEGWDKVYYVPECQSHFVGDRELLHDLIQKEVSYQALFDELNYDTDFRQIYELPHDSTYHSLSVSRHTYYVWDYIQENYEGEDKLTMLWS